MQQGVLRPPVSPADHALGPDNAPVTLVEYGDFECPHCFRAHPIILRLQQALGDRMRLVFRNFPIGELHPHAVEAAQAAESVGAHAGGTGYWKMHHAIFEHQQDSADALDRAHLLQYASRSGAKEPDVERDLEQGTFLPKVEADFASGVRSGVNGTPTLFINGQRFDGDWTNIVEFQDALEEAAAASSSSR